MTRLSCLTLALLFLPLAGGCSPYFEDYHYVPRPAFVELPPAPPQQTPPASASISIIGVRRADSKEGIPESVQVRMRLDNNGPQPIVFDPQTMELTNGTLLRFPPPLLRPPQPINLAPMESAYLDAYFPFPPGFHHDNTDLNSLELRWLLRIGDRTAGQAVNFRRVVRIYYDPYPYWGYPAYPAFGGVVIIRRR